MLTNSNIALKKALNEKSYDFTLKKVEILISIDNTTSSCWEPNIDEYYTYFDNTSITLTYENVVEIFEDEMLDYMFEILPEDIDDNMSSEEYDYLFKMFYFSHFDDFCKMIEDKNLIADLVNGHIHWCGDYCKDLLTEIILTQNGYYD
jgi:hypothetical protein